MKILFRLATLIGLGLPAAALAQSSLDGTWKGDTNSYRQDKPDVYLVQNGIFRCGTCLIRSDIKADGQDHPVSGNPYYDTVSVRLVDAHTVEKASKKAGKVVHADKYVTSADGNAMTWEYVDRSSDSGATTTAQYAYRRVAPGPAGSQSLSGAWQFTHTIHASDNGLQVTYATKGDVLSMSSPTGLSFSAKLDGSFARYFGDPGQDSISMKRVSDKVYKEIDKLGDKVIGTATFTVSADNKTLTIVFDDKQHNIQGQYVMTRQ